MGMMGWMLAGAASSFFFFLSFWAAAGDAKAPSIATQSRRATSARKICAGKRSAAASIIDYLRTIGIEELHARIACRCSAEGCWCGGVTAGAVGADVFANVLYVEVPRASSSLVFARDKSDALRMTPLGATLEASIKLRQRGGREAARRLTKRR